MLWRGFWHRMWWKYVLQSFSAVALMFFTGLFLVAVGIGFSIFTSSTPSARRSPVPGTVLLAVAPLLSGLHFLVSAMQLDIQEGSR